MRLARLRFTLQKYLRLYYAFFKASFVADLEFRANFITRIITDVIWYGAQIFTFEVLFLHTNKLGDWNVDQTRVFLGIVFVVDAFYMIMFHDNLDRMNTSIRKGDLDLLLVKPVSSQFMLSCQRISTAMIGNLGIGTAWLIWSIAQLPDVQWINLLWLLLLLPCGVLAVYCLRFLFSASALIFTQAESVMYLWYQIYRLGLRPDSIYVPWLRFAILTIMPVGFIASVPARAILEPASYGLFAWVLLWTVGLMIFTSWLWQLGLKKYSSASS